MLRYRFDNLAGQLVRRVQADVAEGEHANHPLLAVEHRQAVELLFFHQMRRLANILVVEAISQHAA